ncbi:hypothetical protein N8I77_005018 [Diaporthe amygdali]|uniref:Enoyl reductase (ER) domain-containing protein n=1 Tax=Phomopsis amygdali TaxID=1214568 RepID=A0AAD9SN59_PHOAM|nr:hypothetical protein N8I77_005018 [Diaporthe amygdali]
MTVPSTFKAATFSAPGVRHTVTDVSLPALKPGEVAIKVTATAINPVDWKVHETGVFLPGYPAVLGSDAAGEIAAVGPDVEGFEVGTRVFFQGIIGNYESSTFQQYTNMPAALISRTPSNISDDQAAGIHLGTVAAVTALYDKSGFGLPAPWSAGGDTVGNGKAINIIGGSSSVGQYAIQLAKLSGFSRIVTNSSPAHVEFLKKLGAHVVLDRATESTPEHFHQALNGLPLPLAIDTIAHKTTLSLGIKTLQLAKTPGATLVRITADLEDLLAIVGGKRGALSSEITELAKHGHSVELKGIVGIGSSPSLRHLSEPMADNLGGEDGWISKGLFVPNRPIVVPGGLSALDEALEKNKKGVSGEKVVTKPFEGL